MRESREDRRAKRILRMPACNMLSVSPIHRRHAVRFGEPALSILRGILDPDLGVTGTTAYRDEVE